MEILSILLGLIGALGVGGTFYYGRKALVLARQRVRFSWVDVQEGSRQLGRTVRRRVRPEVIVCFSGPSGIVANLIVQESDYFVPVHTIILEKPGQNLIKRDFVGLELVQTSKWRLHVPSALLEAPDAKVCLVDDAIISGDSTMAVRKLLIERGFKAENIWTCALVASRVAIDSKKGPDKAAFVLDSSVFYLPWGEGY